jgi:hypothetical protein
MDWHQPARRSPSPDLQLMSDDENIPQDLEVDPVYQLAAESGFDLLDFCIEQLEPNGMAETKFWQAEDEEELQVGQNCANEDQLTNVLATDC